MARLLRGKRVLVVAEGDLAARFDGYARIVLDLGAGDAKAALRLARQHPDTLVVAVDATPDAMVPQAVRSLKKPARGGTSNVEFLVSDAASLPPALNGRVEHVTITLPWASLLRAIVLADEALLESLRRVLKSDGVLTIVLNLEPLHQRVPRELTDLPPVGADYVRDTMAPRFARKGLPIVGARELDDEEKRSIHSAWAKRLTAARGPEFLIIESRAAPIP
jgi:16S rRNA (adenine(1408)-N(1))-methyltransferase